MGQRHSRPSDKQKVCEPPKCNIPDESPMDRYETAIRNYSATIHVTFGYGESGKSCIDNIYKDVETAYNALNDQDRKAIIRHYDP